MLENPAGNRNAICHLYLGKVGQSRAQTGWHYATTVRFALSTEIPTRVVYWHHLPIHVPSIIWDKIRLENEKATN